MASIRASMGQFAAVVRGEIRLTLAGAPALAWRALIIFAWSAAAIVMGSLLGLSAVMLPPMAAFAYVGLAALVLLWVMPDLPAAPDKLIRWMLFVALVVLLCVPSYYTVQIASLPWISARRVVTFPLFLLFAIAISTSFESRKRIAQVISRNRMISICVFGYPVAAVLSIATAYTPISSVTALADALIEWYAPFLLILYVLRSEEDVDKLIRLLLWCTLFVSTVGIFDFLLHRRLYLDPMPKALVEQLMANNISFLMMVTTDPIRNGMYRASSLFAVSLSFGEFEAMMAPFAAVFVIHGRTLTERAFGALVLLACLAGIFASGARGGYVSAVVGLSALAALLMIRVYRFETHSMAPAIMGSLVTSGLAVLFAVILFVGRAHNIVLGGGAQAASNDGRRIQWALAWPKIIANPITGHGYGNSGEIVGYISPGALMGSVDSYLLTVITETGLLGVATFFGAILLSIWFAMRRYLNDPTWSGALAGGLGSTLAGFLTYRLVLSQRENMTLMYIMLACVMFLNYYFVEAKAQKPSSRASGPTKLRMSASPGE